MQACTTLMQMSLCSLMRLHHFDANNVKSAADWCADSTADEVKVHTAVAEIRHCVNTFLLGGYCSDLRWRSVRREHGNRSIRSSRVSGEIRRKHLLKPACNRLCYLLNKLVFLSTRQMHPLRATSIDSFCNQLTERLMPFASSGIELFPCLLFCWVRQVKAHGNGLHTHHQSPAFRARRSLRQITPCAMYS